MVVDFVGSGGGGASRLNGSGENLRAFPFHTYLGMVSTAHWPVFVFKVVRTCLQVCRRVSVYQFLPLHFWCLESVGIPPQVCGQCQCVPVFTSDTFDVFKIVTMCSQVCGQCQCIPGLTSYTFGVFKTVMMCSQVCRWCQLIHLPVCARIYF